MKAFTRLYESLDRTTKTNRKIEAMVSYLKEAPPADAAWAIYFLTGRKPKSLIQTPKLINWLIESAKIPAWLFDECYDAVGDLAEAMSILFPLSNISSDQSLSFWIEERLLPLKDFSEEQQHASILQYWTELDEKQRYIYNKLLTGAFRVGVSQQLVIKAIASYSQLDPAVIAHRLMGSWYPNEEFFTSLIAEDTEDSDLSRPYPFYLAYPLQDLPETLGDISQWQSEWKWDGIRAQLIRRQNNIFIWSRGEELITDRYPELVSAANKLPEGTVIDGEILCWREGKVQPFALLQQRIGRKTLTKKMLEEIPVILMAYDLLELNYEDYRSFPLENRRAALVQLLSDQENRNDTNDLANDEANKFKISPLVETPDWNALSVKREQSREGHVEGIMLKRLSSSYRVGRQRGDWWKWKVNPYTIDAVLIYAQSGSGKRASLYTDYTFGVWDGDKLVTIAKAYSGLTDEEIREVDQFVRKNTLEKFGPVRTVKPELVFELAFEAIQLSKRHKAGIAVRFPRILRWRQDKPASEADSLEQLKNLLV